MKPIQTLVILIGMLVCGSIAGIISNNLVVIGSVIGGYLTFYGTYRFFRNNKSPNLPLKKMKEDIWWTKQIKG